MGLPTEPRREPGPPRRPRGGPGGGQFAHRERLEPLLGLESTQVDPGSWRPAHAGLEEVATRDGAFDRCKDVSALHALALAGEGHAVTWIQVFGATTDLPYPDAYGLWHTLERDRWCHFVACVRDLDGAELAIDYTWRQFEPSSPWPLTQSREDFERSWRAVHEVPLSEAHDWATGRGLNPGPPPHT